MKRRAWAAQLLSSALAFAAVPAAAQGVPPLLPQAPPPAITPAGRALTDAFSAINRAMALDPAAATRADFAYAAALARLRMGDTAGALAEAARAQGIAGAASPLAPRPFSVVSPAAGAGSSIASGALLSERALVSAPLPPYVESARMAVLRAAACGADTRKASAHLRDAIDAYTSGDAARARSEARAATNATSASRLPSECRRTIRRS